MRRPMRWYWAALLSIAAYAVAVCGSAVVILGYDAGLDGPLMDAINGVYDVLRGYVGHPAATHAILVALAVPAGVVAVAMYGLLRIGTVQGDGYLHCLKCGYILKGITEPRCPECGERI